VVLVCVAPNAYLHAPQQLEGAVENIGRILNDVQ
jgi:hypothetical protein